MAVPLVPAVGKFGCTEEELYSVVAGRFPDRGYAGQGPFVPLAGRLTDSLAPGAGVPLAGRVPWSRLWPEPRRPNVL
ncbi:hypothetical protein AB0J35_14905 [Nonomuraea angiospora]|uniref:hypothetical protein n=1 Tax=Nonomuraea angiospora TaxID=46172 RepID=UPI00341DD8B1